MVLVDSSVWIDYFRGASSRHSIALDRLLTDELVFVGDLILVEVLQGFRSDHAFERARQLMGSLTPVEIGGLDVAVQAARNYRALRARGVTVRKTIDALIATRCILGGLTLLYSDRDFDPFVEHLGLQAYDVRP